MFLDRKEAGQKLAQKLHSYLGLSPVVLALPRGGAEIAAPIARELNVAFEVLAVRKIGAPFHLELALGALCEDGKPIWNVRLLARYGITPADLNQTIARETERIRAQIELFRGGRRLPEIANRIVVIVDDGLATGATLNAAVQYLENQGAARIVVAVPVAAASAARRLRPRVDELITLVEDEHFDAVGNWYEDFSQVEDRRVIELLNTEQKPNKIVDLHQKQP